jgi:hypothetical protein
MTRRGLLLTMTEPPAAMEEEFNAWYESEHLPERLSIPGFRSARRWVTDCGPGEGKYLATYELDSLGVLSSAEYLARFEGATPWTKRCLGKTLVFRRWACEQVEPGAAEAQPAAKVLALALVLGEQPLREFTLPGALQRRRFVASAGEPRHVTLIELASDVPSTPSVPGAVHALLRYRALG